jgi:opine dehydrogenase
MAGWLALDGFETNLWNRTPRRLEAVLDRGHIRLQGIVESNPAPSIVTTSLEEAVKGTSILMVVVPATAHKHLAARLAPVLETGQIIVLNPGRTGGALEFRQALTRSGCPTRVIVAEAQTFLFASRTVAPGVCHIYSVKRSVPLAAIPATDTVRALAKLNPAFPQFYPARDVLDTGLDNMGAVFHPGVTLLNAAHIEATGGSFDYYWDGMTPAVAQVAGQIDSERMAVAEAYGARVRSARQWLADAYGSLGQTLREAVLANDGYAGIPAPPNLDTRYLREDVPTSLVPLSELGRIAGVRTPAIDAVISLASVIHECDYRVEGRNAHAMGLAGLSPAGIRLLCERGEALDDITASTQESDGSLPR